MKKYYAYIFRPYASYTAFIPNFPEIRCDYCDSIQDAVLTAEANLREYIKQHNMDESQLPEPYDEKEAEDKFNLMLIGNHYPPNMAYTWYKINADTREQFSPAELWLAMTLTLRDDECPYAYFPSRKADMPFCEGSVKEDDDEYYLECPKFKGDGWAKRIGECWLLYAKQQARSANPQEIEEQVWKERCEDRI